MAVNPMMKIQIREMDDEVTFQVEGRLAGAWVTELEQCWRSARLTHPNARFSVDLTGVTYIDQAGRYLLQLMHRDGASFTAAGLMIQGIVDQITGTQ
jgi:anti-anti-sigma regulatory factor